jgi:hypothetical protein
MQAVWRKSEVTAPTVATRGPADTIPTPAKASKSGFQAVGPQTPWWDYLIAIGLFLLAAIATVGPSGNVLNYMVRLRHFGDPTYLAGDWTFGSGFDEHFVWIRVFAPLMNTLGMAVLAPAARIVIWVATALLFIQIGRRLGARPISTVIALIAWLGLNQSMGVGAAKIITEFQASLVAYPLLFGGLVLALRGRIAWSMFLAGLAFAFHPGIGLWGSGALAVSLLWMPDTRAKAWRSIWLLVVAALPGAVPQVLSMLRSTMSADDAAFVALIRVPHHVDPFSFGERGPLLLSIMLAFNLLLHWRMQEEFPHRLLGVFQVVSLIPVILGVVARLTDQTRFLMLIPFRVLPPFATGVFLINLAAIANRRRWDLLWPRGSVRWPDRFRSLAGLGAVIGFMILWNPIVAIANDAAENFSFPAPQISDFELALAWVAAETPVEAQLLGPPDRGDLFVRTDRPQYVSWETIPYDRVPEWRRRLESVMPVGFFDDYPRDRSWADDFALLSQEQLLGLSPAVDYVVTTATYDLPTAFRAGNWAVYEVTQP